MTETIKKMKYFCYIHHCKHEIIFHEKKISEVYFIVKYILFLLAKPL